MNSRKKGNEPAVATEAPARYLLTEDELRDISDRLCQAKAVAGAMVSHEELDDEMRDVFWAVAGIVKGAQDKLLDAPRA